ncbi:hypothetical protein CPB86DRAFT_598862 [Serendipita vermifera]|nr:hypothetical protein CPB86DRAFT_598862 [Serendipita vermifera]
MPNITSVYFASAHWLSLGPRTASCHEILTLAQARTLPFRTQPSCHGSTGCGVRFIRIWKEVKSDSASAENGPRALTFDFGICPGRFIVDRNGVAFVAALVQSYDILPKGIIANPCRIRRWSALVSLSRR